MIVSDLILMPKPKEIKAGEGYFKLPDDGYVLLTGNAQDLMPAAKKIQSAVRNFQIIASTGGDAGKDVIKLILEPGLKLDPQRYELEITPNDIIIRAAAPAGAFYGACTLVQILRQCSEIPCLVIRDWPDFAVRGAMIDVTRNKVPTLDTLYDYIDMLADWKINHIELYTEHAFAYRNHPVVWKEATPITGEDVLLLDKFCAERFIELTPNQNSFGHMTRWLKHEEYRQLSEAPDGCDTVWGHYNYGSSLCPLDPGSIEFVGSLYDELLPHFSSSMVNVGLDETIDLGVGRSKEACEKLGTGRVYLDFLLKVYKEVKKRNHTMLFWGDIIVHHPELISELPKDVIALEWGYEAGHPFKERGEMFRNSGIPFWVCPGTSAWNSIVGRTDNAIENMSNAAKSGLETGATGYLNTDWGDGGHWQYQPVSYLGFMVGAGVSWDATGLERDDIIKALNIFVFQDSTNRMGNIAYDLGNAYKLTGKIMHNASLMFRLLSKSLDNMEDIKDLSADNLREVIKTAEKAEQDIAQTKMALPDAELIKAEYTNAAEMVILGCKMGLIRLDMQAEKDVAEQKADAAEQMRHIITEHERLWLARNRAGGLADSKQKLEDRLKDLES